MRNIQGRRLHFCVKKFEKELHTLLQQKRSLTGKNLKKYLTKVDFVNSIPCELLEIKYFER